MLTSLTYFADQFVSCVREAISGHGQQFDRTHAGVSADQFVSCVREAISGHGQQFDRTHAGVTAVCGGSATHQRQARPLRRLEDDPRRQAPPLRQGAQRHETALQRCSQKHLVAAGTAGMGGQHCVSWCTPVQV